MSIGIVSMFFVLVITLLAYRANTHFQNETHLPMQWGLSGKVNWSAPRHLALGFMPVLAVALLGFVTFMAMNVPPRAGQEHQVLPVSVIMGAGLVAVQLFHFWLVERTLR